MSQATAPAQPQQPAGVPPQEKRKINKRFLIVFSILILGGGSFGIYQWMHGQKHEETDDAQIDANISPVIPRVGGYIREVRVHDNQLVKAGDTLMLLDDRDLAIRVEQAEAALAAAQSSLGVAEATTSASQVGISSTRSAIATIDAQIEVARVAQTRAQQDYVRYNNLVKDHSITQQQYEQAQAAKETADRQLQVLQAQRAAAAQQTATVSSQSAATGRQVSVANAGIRQRQADVEAARLNLSYAAIIAPVDGLVGRVGVLPGQLLQAGQSLFNIVPGNALWVTANFKETQLRQMQTGQRVTVHVDALGGNDLEATVASIAPVTGSKSAVLPPDNASGNFVKVVQRIPVRIEFTDKNDQRLQRLRPGMNVTVDVHLK